MPMKANVENRTGNQVTMSIVIAEPELNVALDKAYQKLVKTVNIRGFRKGHVPRPLLEHYIGKEAFLEEALETMLPDVYSQAVDETGIKPVDHPDVTVQELAEDGSLELKIEVTVEPEVILGEYKGLAAEKTVIVIDEDAVDHSIWHLRDEQAELVTADRDTVQEGDFVTIDYTGYLDGEAFPGGADTDIELEIGSNRFIPGFETGLIGAKLDSEVEINVTFPEDYGATDLAGKEATFKVTVNEIKEKVYPELNDEFAKDVSSFETLAELRADIRGNLEKQAEETATNDLQNTLVDLATKNATIELPEVMIKYEAERLAENFEHRLAYQGLTLDVYMQAAQIDREEFDAKMRSDGEERLRSSLVLEAIAQKEGISVTAEEVDARIEEAATEAGSRAEQVRSTYSTPMYRERLEHSLLLEKTVDLLVEAAQITIKEMAPPAEPGHEDHVL